MNNVIIGWSGTKFYTLNGVLHREDGPAIERIDGAKFWYINGKLHCEDGPAVERPDGYRAWWINGVQLTEEQFKSGNVKELSMAELEKILGRKVKSINR